MKENRIIIALFVLGIIFSLMGGTLAYINWQTTEAQQTVVTFTVTPNFSCSADAGGHITSSDRMLAPTDCIDPEYAIQRTITTLSTTTGDKVISMDLWLNVNSVDANLLNSPNFKYAITKNKNSCISGVINSGVINEDIQNNKINLLEGVEYATLSDTYYLYIWLDEAETNHNTMNQSFDLSIDGQCNDINVEKAYLSIDNSMNGESKFRESAYKTKIKEIHFVYDKDLPEGVIENQVEGKQPYQLSTKANKPIYGYLNQIDDTDTYKLYVTSKYKIYAGNLASAFRGMTGLTTVTFDNFDTSNVTTMGGRLNGMFEDCTSLRELDLSGFNTSKVTDMTSMFAGCSSLTSLDVSSFDTSSLVKVTDNVVGAYKGMFYGCSSLTELDITNFDTSHIANMNGFFQNCSSLTSLDLSHFDTSSATSLASMFQGCSSLTELDLTNFNTTKVTDMGSMFQNCSKLTSLDLSSFNTLNVAQMGSMFWNCSRLTSLDLSNFNTSKVTNMGRMFQGCGGLTKLDLTSFNTSIVTNMGRMFDGCSNLELLDLSSFNTANVKDMYAMFSSASKLKTVYVSELWNTDAVTDSRRMFGGCNSLVGESGTKYNVSYQDKTYARIDNPPDNPGYFTYKSNG